MNVQLPSCKTHYLHNSLFHEGSKLWNSLSTALHNLSSRQFRSKVWDLFLTKKISISHLHGCNTNATTILCMLRLATTIRYVNMVLFETELHIFFNVLPPTHHTKCRFLKFIRLLLKKCVFPFWIYFTKLRRIDRNISLWTSRSI